MNRALLLALLLSLAACDRQATLPEDPIERAATCGVVATAEARVNTPEIGAPLSLDAQGRVLRLVLLAGATEDEFSSDRAQAVVQRMPALAENVTAGDNWKELAPACAAAFPTPTATPALPQDPLTAALGCDELARFMDTALSASGDYEEPLFRYLGLANALDGRIASLLGARGIASEDAQAAEKREALSAAAKLGNPVEVLELCVARFSPEQASPQG